MSKTFEFNNNNQRKNNISFEYPYKELKPTKQLNISEKWSQLDNKFNNKINRHINFYDDFETKNNLIIENSKKENINNINLSYLIHPIDDEFDEFIEEKINVLENLKDNKYIIKEEINDDEEENNNFNLIINKYKKQESLVKEKNEPIFILNNNNNKDLNYKYEFNKMKSKKYFFNENKENNSDIGKRNKMRLNNILKKIKKENIKNEIINVPNKFEILNKEEKDINIKNTKYFDYMKNKNKKDEENKDYFDKILDQININNK